MEISRAKRCEQANERAQKALSSWRLKTHSGPNVYPFEDLPQEVEAKKMYWWDRALTAENHARLMSAIGGLIAGAAIYMASTPFWGWW